MVIASTRVLPLLMHVTGTACRAGPDNPVVLHQPRTPYLLQLDEQPGSDAPPAGDAALPGLSAGSYFYG